MFNIRTNTDTYILIFASPPPLVNDTIPSVWVTAEGERYKWFNKSGAALL